MPGRLCLFLCAMLLLVGCSSSPDPFELSLRGIAPLNLNDEGESTPVDVRIYQLRASAKFTSAAFNQLWTEDLKVLAADRLTDPRVISVFPGNANDKPVKIDLGVLNKDTKFIGIMALFPKEPEKGKRRAIVPVGDGGSHLVELKGFSVTYEPKKKD